MKSSPRPASRPYRPRSLSVGIVLAPDFTLAAFSLFVETLSLAADETACTPPVRAHWTVLAETSRPIRSSSGVRVTPDDGFVDPARFDYVVVIGGIMHGRHPAPPALYAYLRRAAAAGVKLVGICTGTFILCRAGLMDGRRVCVSWLHYQDFRDTFPGHPIVGDRLFDIDGDRITCAGGAGAADVAAWMIETDLGGRLRRKPHQASRFVPGGSAGALQPHPSTPRAVDDERVCRALLMMEQNMSDPVPIAAIARRLDLSTRQLERRFEATLGQRPSEIYRALRFRYAQSLLETTDRTVTDIALETGFADCAHFSRQFRALYGVSPSRARPAASRRERLPEAGFRAGPRSF